MRTVLIVDDEAIARHDLREHVGWAALGCRVVGEAADGREALDLISRLAPDIVLLDIKMPVLDGLDVLREAQRLRLPSKFVVLSCFEDYQYVREALRMGAQDYLLKHLYREEDIARVVSALEQQYSKERADQQYRLHVFKEHLQSLFKGQLSCDQLFYDQRVGIFPDKPCRQLLVSFFATEGVLQEMDAVDAGAIQLAGRREGERLLYMQLPETGYEAVEARLLAALERAVDGQLAVFRSDDLLELNQQYHNYMTLSADVSSHSSKIKMAIEFMGAHFAENISLSDVADHVGISRAYLSQLFPKETGENFSEWLLNYRLNKAAQLLKTGYMKVYEVAQQAGFKSQPYFSLCFKRAYGMSPLEYRDLGGSDMPGGHPSS